MIRRITRKRIVFIGIAIAYSIAAPAHAYFSLDPGTVIAQDSTGQSGTQFTLVKYSQATGATLQTLPISSVPSGFGTMDGLSVVGNRLFALGNASPFTNGTVAEVDLNTGNLFNPFSAGVTAAEALGNIGNDLLTGSYNTGTIKRYSTAGVLLSTITLSVNVGLTGLDSDGSQLFVGSYNNGNIYRFDLTGALLGIINTNIGASSLSGLGYDSTSGNLWVSTGYNQDDIRQYSSTGSLIGSFPSNYPFIVGLDVVPIPEPGSLMLLSIGAIALSSHGRRALLKQ